MSKQELETLFKLETKQPHKTTSDLTPVETARYQLLFKCTPAESDLGNLVGSSTGGQRGAGRQILRRVGHGIYGLNPV